MITAARYFTFAVVALFCAVAMDPLHYALTLLFTLGYGILSGIKGWEMHKEASLSLLKDDT